MPVWHLKFPFAFFALGMICARGSTAEKLCMLGDPLVDVLSATISFK